MPRAKKDTDNTDIAVKRTKMKPRGGNSPVIGNNGLMVEPGDNTNIVSVNFSIMRLPNIDMHDPQAVADRIDEVVGIYASNDLKPTISGIAMGLNGMSRQTFRAIGTDASTGSDGYKSALPKEVTAVIKRAYLTMELLWESYFTSGKFNPVTGIFLGKNNFGYRDQQDLVVAPQQNVEEYSKEDIEARYRDLSNKLPE